VLLSLIVIAMSHRLAAREVFSEVLKPMVDIVVFTVTLWQLQGSQGPTSPPFLLSLAPLPPLV